MPNELGINSHSIMAMGEGARALAKVIKFAEMKSNERKEMTKLAADSELKNVVFGEVDKREIKDILSRLDVTTDNKGKPIDDISVRLFKGYMAPAISDTMRRSDIGCIRMVRGDDGMIAVLYSTEDEERMSAALTEMEKNLGASVVVDTDTLQKMANARGKPEMFEINNLSHADAIRFEYAAQRFSVNIAISEDTANSSESESKFKITAMSSDEKKFNKIFRDVAISKTSTNADAFDRAFTRVEDVTGKAIKMAVNQEKFYVCSPTRPQAFIEVTKDGFRVFSQKDSALKVAKEVEGATSSPKVFKEFAHKLKSFENPVLLTEEEFSMDQEERLAEVLGKIEVLEQEQSAKAFVTDLTSTVLLAANSCGYEIYNVSSLKSDKFFDKIENSKFISDKESVYVAIAQLQNLPQPMVNEVIKEYRSHLEELENSITEIEELGNDGPDVDAPTPPQDPVL